jgi:sugar lactone lactonase YvrE
VPALQASSVAFGDPDLRTLYITSAALGPEPGAYPDAGSLFRTRVDIPGLPVGRP